MGMNDIRPSRPAMPSQRSNGTIFPQPVGGQNVEISADHGRHKLIRVTPRAPLWLKRLNTKRLPVLQINGTLFVADTKNARTRTRARHRLGQSAHALKKSSRFARNAADNETDFHVLSHNWCEQINRIRSMAAGPPLQALFQLKIRPRPEPVAKRDAQAVPPHLQHAEPRAIARAGDIAL